MTRRNNVLPSLKNVRLNLTVPELLQRIVILCCLICLTAESGAEPAGFYLLSFGPGRTWQVGAEYTSQPDISHHMDYLQQLYERDVLVMGGVYEQGDGSMMVVRVGTLSQAQQLIAEDPAVKAGTLQGTARGWQVRMSSMRHVERDSPNREQAQTFRLERLNPDSAVQQLED
jgi:uncharacterized protein YciI